MIILIASIILTIIVLIINYKNNYFKFSPPIVCSTIWLFSYLVMINEVSENNLLLIVFALVSIFFSIGFYIAKKVYKPNSYHCSINSTNKSLLVIKKKFWRLSVLFLLIVLIIDVFTAIKFASSYNIGDTFWIKLKFGTSEGLYNRFFLSGIATQYNVCMMLVCTYMYMRHNNKTNRNRLILMVMMYVGFCFLAQGRGFFYEGIIATFSLVLYEKKFSVKLIKLGFVMVFVLITIFYIFGSMKYAGATLIDQIRAYFGITNLAFLKWFNNGFDYHFGSYTFNSVLSIFKIFIPSLKSIDTVENFITVNGLQTNVYTILQYYCYDFGILYSLLIQLLFGYTHGVFYFKSLSRTSKLEKNIFYTIMTSLLFFPLITSIFHDYYFSLLNLWIYLILFTKIIVKCGISYEVKKKDYSK